MHNPAFDQDAAFPCSPPLGSSPAVNRNLSPTVVDLVHGHDTTAGAYGSVCKDALHDGGVVDMHPTGCKSACYQAVILRNTGFYISRRACRGSMA